MNQLGKVANPARGKFSRRKKKMYMYGHTYSKSMDQPGKVANPARGQLNRENEKKSLYPFAPEKLISRDGFGRPVPRQPTYSLYPG